MSTPSLKVIGPQTASAVECAHCGSLILQGAALRYEGRDYCCDGCKTVAEIVHAGGWEEFYRLRDGFSPRPEDASAGIAFDGETFQAERVKQVEPGRCAVDLQLAGLRCAACTWLVERAVGALPGVADVHVSYTSARAHIEYDPSRLKLSQVAERVATLGYRTLVSDTRPRIDFDLIARVGVAAFSAMNVMLLAVAVYAGWFDSVGMDERHAALFAYASLLLATPAVFYSAEPFFVGAIGGLRHRYISMDVPIALAIAVMYVHGIWATFFGHEPYLDSLTMLIALLLGGRLLESSGRRRAEDAASSVLAAAPTVARRLRNGVIDEVASDALVVGDHIVVGLGGVVPADSTVIAGSARVDVSLLTGESEPIVSGVDVDLPAGAIVREGELTLSVRATGSATLLAQMAERVRGAQSSRSKIARLPDLVAPWFTLGTLVVGAATFAIWYARGGIEAAMPVTIAVLVVACPCALALATPTALSIGLAAAARRGAWLRDPDVLLRLARIDEVAVDKTGTVTEGRPRVVDGSDEVIALAAALERASSHPIARAVLDEARARRIPIGPASNVVETPGVGIRGRVQDREVEIRSAGEALGVYVDGELLGAFGIRDRIRADSARALEALGVPVVMLSGDHAEVVRKVAEQAGATEAQGGLSPSEKASWVESRRAAGRHVLFAGDGLNDAPALAAANVGVAMGTGAMATVLAADAVVLEPSLRPVAEALRAARITRQTLRALTAISATYNVTAVFAAAIGLVNPLVAAILMPISSLTVILGAMSIETRMRHGHNLRTVAPLARDGVALRLPLRTRSA